MNKSPIRYDFCGGGAKAARYSVNIALVSKTTSLSVHHTFWYISLPSLHHHDVKLPNLKFYGELKQMTKNLDIVLKNSIPGGLPSTFGSEQVGIMAMKIERTPIYFVRDFFPDVIVVVS